MNYMLHLICSITDCQTIWTYYTLHNIFWIFKSSKFCQCNLLESYRPDKNASRLVNQDSYLQKEESYRGMFCLRNICLKPDHSCENQVKTEDMISNRTDDFGHQWLKMEKLSEKILLYSQVVFLTLSQGKVFKSSLNDI